MISLPRSENTVKLTPRVPLRDIIEVDFSKYGNGASQSLAKEILGGVVEESAKLIDKYYGLTANNRNISFEWGNLDEGVVSATSWADGTDDITISLSSDYFGSKEELTDDELIDLRMAVLHELTHAFLHATLPELKELKLTLRDTEFDFAEVLSEGMAEFIASGGYRTHLFCNEYKVKIGDSISGLSEMTSETVFFNNFDESLKKEPWNTEVEESQLMSQRQGFYVQSYLVTVFLDSCIRRSGIEFGLKTLLRELKVLAGESGELTEAIFNKALAKATRGECKTIYSFYDRVLETLVRNPRECFRRAWNIKQTDFINDDAFVVGGYLTEGLSLTYQERADSLATGRYKANPLDGYGSVKVFNETPDVVVIPDKETKQIKKLHGHIPMKMLDETIDLSHTADGETRYLWRMKNDHDYQLITGRKIFNTSPTRNGVIATSNNLSISAIYGSVCVNEIPDILGYYGIRTKEITLTEQDIENGEVEFYEGRDNDLNRASLHVKLDGAGALISGTDYSINKKPASWTDRYFLTFSDALKAQLIAGDKMTFTFERATGVTE